MTGDGAADGSPRAALPRTPSFRLDGRRALVTGAGRGLGLACAAALAEAGAAVTLMARGAPELERVAASIRAAGGQAETLAIDVCDAEGVRAALDSRGAFDVLVNNAGGNRPAPFLEVTEADFDFMTDLNLRAAFFVAQAVARKMRDDGRRGSIIHMSSQMGHVGGATRTVYCATKHAIEGLTKAMAIDLAPYGIRVNSICPTFIETPMTAKFFEDAAFKSSLTTKIKLGRIGAVEDIMGAVTFLAGDASALMTGASILVDGGWTAD